MIDLGIVRDTIIDYSISKINDFDNDLMPHRQINMTEYNNKKLDELH